MSTKVITRKQYMDGEATHREYNSQFVNRSVKWRVLQHIGEDKLRASTDEHLNDIPLKKWDQLGSVGSRAQWDATGDWPTMAGFVCIHKEAARQLIEDFQANTQARETLNR